MEFLKGLKVGSVAKFSGPSYGSATSSNPSILTAVLVGNILTVTGLTAGSVTVVVTLIDGTVLVLPVTVTV